MVKVFIIIGLVLVIAGVPGLYWCSFQNDQQQQRIAFCKAKYKHQVDEYVKKLTGSSLKPTDENAVKVAITAPNPEKMKPSERLEYQQERLLADIEDLAESEQSAPINANMLYGDGWRQKVAEYRANKQSITNIRVASATASLAGVVLFAAALVFLVFRIIASGIGRTVKACTKTDKQAIPEQRAKPVQEERLCTAAISAQNVAMQAAKTPGPSAEEFRRLLVAQTESLKETAEQLKNLAGVLNERATEQDNALSKRLEKGFKTQHESFKHENEHLKKLAEDIRTAVESQSDKLAKTVENSMVSHADAIRSEAEKSQQIAEVSHNETVRLYTDGFRSIRQQIEELIKAVQASTSQQATSADIGAQLEQAISSQTEGLKKEIEPLREIMNALQASDSQQAASANIGAQLEQAVNSQMESLKKEVEPLREIMSTLGQTLEQVRNAKSDNSTDEQLKQETIHVRKISEEALAKNGIISKNISDLTEQVCAIREYAARQQQRLAKLQDGYDWNLIKNFCLRVIRCVDNLDDRISGFSCSGGNAEHLVAVREELSFILESNGVEPFGAKIDSDYRGQENRLQVLNERDETDDSQLIGKIAQVVRQGYQCRVNDEYTKIVRPAQVRLYGPICLSDVAVRGS